MQMGRVAFLVERETQELVAVRQLQNHIQVAAELAHFLQGIGVELATKNEVIDLVEDDEKGIVVLAIPVKNHVLYVLPLDLFGFLSNHRHRVIHGLGHGDAFSARGDSASIQVFLDYH